MDRKESTTTTNAPKENLYTTNALIVNMTVNNQSVVVSLPA